MSKRAKLLLFGIPIIVIVVLGTFYLADYSRSLRQTSTSSISAAGGDIKSKDKRLTLKIPAGALRKSTNISIRRVTRKSSKLPKRGKWLKFGYELLPSGTKFEKPARVILNLSKKDVGPLKKKKERRAFPLYTAWLQNKGEGPELVDGTKLKYRETGGVAIEASVSHFSLMRFLDTGLASFWLLPDVTEVGGKWPGNWSVSLYEFGPKITGAQVKYLSDGVVGWPAKPSVELREVFLSKLGWQEQSHKVLFPCLDVGKGWAGAQATINIENKKTGKKSAISISTLKHDANCRLTTKEELELFASMLTGNFAHYSGYSEIIGNAVVVGVPKKDPDAEPRPARNAEVTIKLTKPNGTAEIQKATTDGRGKAGVKFKIFEYGDYGLSVEDITGKNARYMPEKNKVPKLTIQVTMD